MWPRSCLYRGLMELIKGRKTGRSDSRTEQIFRVPATEEIWEVTCSDERECEEREVRTARKRPDFPIAS
jgi:hypothetical protein